MNEEIVILSKTNANLAIAIPLYGRLNASKGHDYKMVLLVGEDKPVAYAVDIGEPSVELFGAEFLKERCEFLGDL